MNKIQNLRKEIDEIDNQLLILINKRLVLVWQIGDIKKQLNKPIRDPKRERERIDTLTLKAKQYSISREIVKKIWQTLFEISYIIEG